MDWKCRAVTPLKEGDHQPITGAGEANRDDRPVPWIGYLVAIGVSKHIIDVLLRDASLRVVGGDVTQVVIVPDGSAWLHR